MICRVFGRGSDLLQPWKDRSCVGHLPPPWDVKPLWNKAPGIWFPRWAGHAAGALARGGPAHCVSAWVDSVRSRCVLSQYLYDARLCPRQGGRELSAKKRSQTEGAQDRPRPQKPSPSDKKARKQRSGDLGRALRTIYDDTLREPVPDDFASLIGKLS